MGAEKEIIDTYVTAGQVKIIYWPITDIGPRSVDAAAAAHCVGEQNADLFWAYHDLLFENYGETYRGDRDYFIDQAAAVGADREVFAACFDEGESHAFVRELDQERRDMGILQRPTFDINGQFVYGAPPFETFDAVIQEALQ